MLMARKLLVWEGGVWETFPSTKPQINHKLSCSFFFPSSFTSLVLILIPHFPPPPKRGASATTAKARSNNNLNYHRHYSEHKSWRHKNNHKSESFFFSYAFERRKEGKGSKDEEVASTEVINESQMITRKNVIVFMAKSFRHLALCNSISPSSCSSFILMYHNVKSTQRLWIKGGWSEAITLLYILLLLFICVFNLNSPFILVGVNQFRHTLFQLLFCQFREEIPSSFLQ